nr:ABC transporter permease [Rhizobium sp. L245/93]
MHNRFSKYKATENLKQSFWLVFDLTQREFSQRYKGTFLGVLWPIVYSLLFLAIFSFIFTVVLSVRWGSAPGNGALMIFCGLVPHLFISEVMSRSPTVIHGATNLVKKVRFPVRLIPVVSVNAAFILCIINLILLIFFGIIKQQITIYSLVILPAIMLPLYLFAVGLGWFLSALGVFFRDISQIAPVAVQLMMFLAPVFYPLQNIPEKVRPIFLLNPLTYFIEALRNGLDGHISWSTWAAVTLFYACFALTGAFVFRRLRPAFGDLL